MKFIRKYKKTTAIITIAAYLFIALFSQLFHQHHFSHHKTTDYTLSTEKKTFSENQYTSKDHCLSCHFLLEGNAVSIDSFENIYFSNPEFQPLKQEIQNYFTQEKIQHFLLRGPPNHIV
jgi:cytochrome c